ncbi:MAG: hypothetical protein IJD10_07040 [Clostridia bacterium]|nr:hypothetical protein [Clostridia bacterium]
MNTKKDWEKEQSKNSEAQATYSSKWREQMDGLLKTIQNRKAFSYDVTKDPLFRQAKDQAISGGRMAMQDTMGQAATMTGGYGSSYGQSVGQQVYQENLKSVNDKIPELYDLAYSRYADEGNRMLTEYGLLADREGQDYSRFLDDRSFEYQKGRDDIADAQWRKSFDYDKDRDHAEDKRYEDNLAYEKDLEEAAIAASLGDYSKYKDLGFDTSKAGTVETTDTKPGRQLSDSQVNELIELAEAGETDMLLKRLDYLQLLGYDEDTLFALYAELTGDDVVIPFPDVEEDKKVQSGKINVKNGASKDRMLHTRD